MTIDFHGRVAIVTGAGNGLGRSHALALAARGAKVVVNDRGGSRDGSGASHEAARKVVEDITAMGGEALANGADVTDPTAVEAMMAVAMERWGRIDILVNNAGILRDKSFAKMTLEDFRQVLDVHLTGSFVCAKAVWETMRAQGYGRIVFTTSASGLFGNFGQANYAAAKMGCIGLMNVLHIEGEKHNIRVNALSPCAATRMTEELLPPSAQTMMAPEAISPGLLYLVSENAPSKTILSAGAGVFAVASVEETAGVYLPPEARLVEDVAAQWPAIEDPVQRRPLSGALAQTQKLITAALKGFKAN